MAKHLCEKCGKEFEGQFTCCNGFCRAIFCLQCSGMTENYQEMIASNSHITWLCLFCKTLLSKARFQNAMVSLNASNEALIDSFKSEMKESILQEIRQEIRTSLNSVKLCSTPKPNLENCSLATPSSTSKRRRIDSIVGNSASIRPTPKLCAIGTNQSDLEISVRSRETQGGIQDSSLFWLYLSGILPSAPEERVLAMVRAHLGIQEVMLAKLIPKGRDVRSLSFMSYKVGIPMDLKPKALSTETWPAGIRFREFIDTKPRQDFLKFSPQLAPPQIQLTIPQNHRAAPLSQSARTISTQQESTPYASPVQ